MDLFKDPEEQIVCHFIIRIKLVECDFNVNHKIPEPELQYHHEKCPDKPKVEHTACREEAASIDRYPVHITTVEAEKSRNHLNITFYDPKYCQKSNVLRHLDAAPPSSRKNFRMGKRDRLKRKSNNTPGPSTTVQQPSTSGFGRILPKRSRIEDEEVETPNSIIDHYYTERIKTGKNMWYIPK